MSIHFARICCLISLLLTPMCVLAGNTATSELTVGVEPFASTNVIGRIINEQVNTALHSNGSPTIKYLGSLDIAEFKSQVAKQEFSLFYGHPGYASYLAENHGFIPIIALVFDMPAVIITSKNNPASFKKNTTAYTMEDHDIFAYLGRKLIKDKKGVSFVKTKRLESVISGVFSTPQSVGLIAKSDLNLMIPAAREQVKVINESERVKYSYLMVNPKRVSNTQQLLKNLMNAHSALANDKSSYFYGVLPEQVTESHIQYAQQYKAFQAIFDQY